MTNGNFLVDCNPRLLASPGQLLPNYIKQKLNLFTGISHLTLKCSDAHNQSDVESFITEDMKIRTHMD